MAFNNAAVWLMLAGEGGRWTAAEVAARLGMDQSSVASNLRAMTEFGTMQRWERNEADPASRVRFGVTPDCTVPRGIKVRLINQALHGAVDEESEHG